MAHEISSALRSCVRVALVLLSFLGSFAAENATAQQSESAADRANVYFFGNSLIHHLSDSPQTNVPVWVSQMARSAGVDFAADGQWGFLRNFTTDLPPTANWSFPNVSGVWNPDRQNFDAAEFDSVVLVPANFIQ